MSKKILIVDDEADIRDILNKALSSRGYEVVTAVNGADGLQKVQQEKPDLVILDVVMPIMNGKELLRRLKEDPAYQDMPVVMLTSQSSDRDVMDGYVTGADYYITKPFTIPTIMQGLKMMLEGENKSGPKKYDLGG